MAENEVKNEKQKISISFWFFVFLIYLIISLLFIMKQNNELEFVTAERDSLSAQLNSVIENSNTRSETLINSFKEDLQLLIDKYAQEDTTTSGDEISVEVTTGTYTGSDDVTSMTLTLSEDNIASLTTASGDAAVEGTYSVSENTVVFTSNDGATTHSFTVVDANTLKLVDSELTLSK